MRKDSVIGIGVPFVIFLAFIGAWWFVADTFYGNAKYILPSPLDTFIAGRDNFPDLVSAFFVTLFSALNALAFAGVVGVCVAVAMSQSRMLERGLYPYAIMLQTVPIVSIIPIIVLWWGFTRTSVVIVAFIMALFPIINNTLLGLKSIDAAHEELFRMHKAGRFTVLTKLRFPGAVPYMVAGFRIASGLSVIGAIVGEFIIGTGGSARGLGVSIIFAQAQLKTPLLFAQVIAATLLGIGLFLLVSLIGSRITSLWETPKRAIAEEATPSDASTAPGGRRDADGLGEVRQH